LAFTYGTATASGGAPPITIACTPASGSLFNIGSTTVTCTATDSRQRSDACSFNVTILQPPKIQVTRFLAFGDSITYGENGISSVAFGAYDQFKPLFRVAQNYPTVLYQTLALRYTTQNIVVGNEGYPGELASYADARARLSSILGSGRWDVALILEGSNDVDTGKAATIQAAVSSLASMVRDAKSRGVRPYLATIPPMDGLRCCPRRGSQAPLVPGFNDQLRSIAASENIPLVDIYSALNASPSQYLSEDGLHPNEAGYAKMAETFFAALKGNLETAPTASSTFGFTPLPPLYSLPGRRR
jgi:lysophospholipase L1-like esterase